MKIIRLTARETQIENLEDVEKFMEICRSHDLTLVDFGWKNWTTSTIGGVESLNFCHKVIGYDKNGNSRKYFGHPETRFDANKQDRIGRLGVFREIPRNDDAEINRFFGIE